MIEPGIAVPTLGTQTTSKKTNNIQYSTEQF